MEWAAMFIGGAWGAQKARRARKPKRDFWGRTATDRRKAAQRRARAKRARGYTVTWTSATGVRHRRKFKTQSEANRFAASLR